MGKQDRLDFRDEGVLVGEGVVGADDVGDAGDKAGGGGDENGRSFDATAEFLRTGIQSDAAAGAGAAGAGAAGAGAAGAGAAAEQTKTPSNSGPGAAATTTAATTGAVDTAATAGATTTAATTAATTQQPSAVDEALFGGDAALARAIAATGDVDDPDLSGLKNQAAVALICKDLQFMNCVEDADKIEYLDKARTENGVPVSPR